MDFADAPQMELRQWQDGQTDDGLNESTLQTAGMAAANRYVVTMMASIGPASCQHHMSAGYSQ